MTASAPIRLLIDLQGAQTGSRHRGIGRYALSLAIALLREPRGHEMSILLNGAFVEHLPDLLARLSPFVPRERIFIFDIARPVEGLVKENGWRRAAAEAARQWLIDRIDPDVVLITSLFEGAIDDGVTAIPARRSRTKVACILYDLIPLSEPSKYLPSKASEDWYYSKLASLQQADLLLAISKSAALEGQDLLSIPPSRSAVIMSAASEIFENRAGWQGHAAVLAGLKITRRFIMHTSAFEGRKNFEGLVRAFGLIPRDVRAPFQLVFVAAISIDDQNRVKALAREHGLSEDELVYAGRVNDDELITLYSECEVFAFPPFHEGFGLPALEAMCCGAAVIGSNVTSIPEVIGRSDALFDPFDDQSIADLMQRIMLEPNFRLSLREHAVEQAKRFTWAATADLALIGIERLAPFDDRPAQPAAPQDLFDAIRRLSGHPTGEDLVALSNAISQTFKRLDLLPTHSSDAVGLPRDVAPVGVPLRRYASATVTTQSPSILILKLDHIGDFLISLEAFEIVRGAWPTARITLVCGPWNTDLAEGSGLFDEVVACAFLPEAGSDFDREAVRRRGLEAFRACELGAFDLAADFRCYEDSRFLLEHVEAGVRIGYAGGGVSLDLSLPDVPETTIKAQVGARVAALASAMVWTYSPGSGVTPRTLLAGRERVALFTHGLVVGVAPGAGNSIKAWGASRFAALARQLVDDLDARIVILGGGKDVEAAAIIAADLPPERARNLAGSVKLTDLAPVLAGLDLFIGNDTGTTHFASALDVPTLCLFSGQSHVDSWRPKGSRAVTLKGQVGCSPCYIVKLEDCPRDHWCMEMSPFQVMDVVREMVATLKRPG